MLIDAILDRKADRVEGIFNYNPKEFYDYLMDWDADKAKFTKCLTKISVL